MTLKAWEANRWLIPHTTTREEVEDLLAIVDRDLADAAVEDLSPDWRLGIACNAALYERVGTTSDLEAHEVYAIAKELRTRVVAWLKTRHAQLYGA